MEQQEFQHIAATLRPRLLKLCTHFFDSQELAYEAEDAVQETLLRLWQHREKMEIYQSPEALAMLIAKNVCIDIMRRGATWHDKLDECLYVEADNKQVKLHLFDGVESYNYLLRDLEKLLPAGLFYRI